jgi:nucleoid-associated protein YgaU
LLHNQRQRLEAKNKLTAASANDVRPKTSSVATTAGEEYTVKAGDHLIKLADQFYGAQSKWEKIYQANRRTMNNPHFICIGQRIIDPARQQARNAKSPGAEFVTAAL